jgi:glycosyltransferase involved in cell wall biosynthesis
VGAGVKGKIMSALSYGLPIVSSSIGVEGSGLQSGVHALVADTPHDFAAAVLRLYRDAALWHQLSQAGQALLRTEFSTAKGAAVLNEAIALAHRRKAGLHGVAAA